MRFSVHILLLASLLLDVGQGEAARANQRDVFLCIAKGVQNSSAMDRSVGLGRVNILHARADEMTGFDNRSIGRIEIDGVGYYLRLPDPFNNTRRELFAVHLAQQAGLRVPDIRRISQKQAQAFLEQNQTRFQPGTYREISEELARPGRVATLSREIDGIEGTTYFLNFGNELDFRKAIDWWLQGDPTSMGDILDNWKYLSPKEKERVMNSFRSLSSVDGSPTVGTFPKYLAQNYERLRGAGGDDMVWLGAQTHIPSHQLTQLSDQTAIFSLLGLRDPHTGNWIRGRDGQIWSIDLAEQTGTRTSRRNPLLFQDQDLPITQFDFSERLFGHLLRNVSPEMRRFLTALDIEQVGRFAQEAGYDLGIRQRRQIETRLRYIQENYLSP